MLNAENDAEQQQQQRADQFNLDETPPPLPPRSHSLCLPLAGSAGGVLTLKVGETHNKPLPTIPTSESYNEGLIDTNNHSAQSQLAPQFNSKDALNNFINNEKSAEHMSDRPLPPLPSSNQQQQQHYDGQDRMLDSESDSDESEIYENDSENDNELKNIDNENENNDKNVNDDVKRLTQHLDNGMDNVANALEQHKNEPNANSISKTFSANENEEANKWNGTDTISKR